MGRKSNNMPLRKKKIKDKNNFQIQGKAGCGKKRAKGRERQSKERTKESINLERGILPDKQKEKEKQISWVELAKQQEEKALAAQQKVPEAEPPKKGKKRKAKAAAQEKKHPQGLEHTRVSREDLRTNCVHFDYQDETKCDEGQEAQKASPKLEPGSLVSLFGLQSAPDLNGRLATCINWDSAKGRWRVTLEGSGSEKLLKPQNLKTARLLCPFTPVRLVGLQSSPELNGKTGTCKIWDSAKSRWLVKLDDGGERLLKPGNLGIAFRSGSSVRLTGLQASHLNGISATCIQWDKIKERWHVRLEEGLEKFLKPENLEAHGPQELPPLSPLISQKVHLCEEKQKLEEILQFLKKLRVDEKKGSIDRALMVIFCTEAAAVTEVSNFLSGRQFSCLRLVEQSEQKKLLREFNLEKKRIIVTTDSAARGLQNVEHLHFIFNYDFPSDMKQYCQRASLLLPKDCENPVSRCYHSFFSSQSPSDLAKELLSFLQRTKAQIDPALKVMAAGKERPGKKRHRWRRHQSKTVTDSKAEGGKSFSTDPCKSNAETDGNKVRCTTEEVAGDSEA
eukprot:TRINITY_DN10363_c0_g1_i2.p1 TRINITY_DN10363_c0_g1~~TRINITY_DN10363_c0_g1_i2.p1  ORF type:complete len:563 (-),score=132.01 TRINITY_DN10363_c0_g1_i2:931-2619(-)